MPNRGGWPLRTHVTSLLFTVTAEISRAHELREGGDGYGSSNYGSETSLRGCKKDHQ